MVSTTIQRKSDHWFNLVDVNGDGRIQQSDLRALGERILNHFGQSKGSPEGKRLLQEYDRAWVVMADLMDTDKNQEISKEEFETYMEQHARKGNADDLLRPITDAEFAAADTDGDGALSPAEYAELLKALGLSGTDAEVGMEAIDTNRDGVITPEEYFRASRDFFAGGELGARTSQVFGQVR